MKTESIATFLLLPFLFAASATADDAAVSVVVTTTQGDITIALYPEKAPVTVANFLRYVDGEHYDGASFYRVVTYENDNGAPKIEVIQGGLGDAESPFPPIAHETTKDTGLLHRDGVISMARLEVGTASSEFFICIGDQPGLDHGAARYPDGQGFAAFGRVTAGMDIVIKINKLEAGAPSDSAYTAGQILSEPVIIERIRRLD